LAYFSWGALCLNCGYEKFGSVGSVLTLLFFAGRLKKHSLGGYGGRGSRITFGAFYFIFVICCIMKNQMKDTGGLIEEGRYFAIQAITGITILKYEDVLLFEYVKNMRRWQVRLVSDKVYRLRSTATSASILSISSSFIQISQFCIINLIHLLSIENKTLKCIFDVSTAAGGDQKVSPLYYKKMKSLLPVL
jgi:hypothetical protein